MSGETQGLGLVFQMHKLHWTIVLQAELSPSQSNSILFIDIYHWEEKVVSDSPY